MHYSLEKSNFAQLYQLYMKKYIAMVLLSAGVLSSCGEYNKVLKSTDYEYKYEAAKSYFAKGQNSRAATILEELIPILKGTANGEESLYMLAMTYYNQGDFVTASHYFNTYYTTYPRGTYTELARFHSGKALYLDTPEPRLDEEQHVQGHSGTADVFGIFPYKSAKGYSSEHDFRVAGQTGRKGIPFFQTLL